MQQTVKLEIYGRQENGMRKSEALHSECFCSHAKAQKFCKTWKRGFKTRLCNYFFRFIIDDCEGWFTLNWKGDLVEIPKPSVADDKILKKELFDIEANISELKAIVEDVERENEKLRKAITSKTQEISMAEEEPELSPEYCRLRYLKFLNTPNSIAACKAAFD